MIGSCRDLWGFIGIDWIVIRLSRMYRDSLGFLGIGWIMIGIYGYLQGLISRSMCIDVIARMIGISWIVIGILIGAIVAIQE